MPKSKHQIPGRVRATYEFIQAHRSRYSVQALCRILEVAPSAILGSFIEYLESGLGRGLSPQRAAQIEVVSDVLEQAHTLLEDSRHHPAAAAMLIGAALEEFLRTWVEAAAFSLGKAKPGIDAYAKVLRAADVITKQDVKDITSWVGVRNHAAHGEWDEVSDRGRIRLMLEGVNLFMRQNQPTA